MRDGMKKTDLNNEQKTNCFSPDLPCLHFGGTHLDFFYFKKVK